MWPVSVPPDIDPYMTKRFDLRFSHIAACAFLEYLRAGYVTHLRCEYIGFPATGKRT